MKNLILIIGSLVFLFGCSTGGAKFVSAESSLSSEEIKAIRAGNVKLTCFVSCSGTWGSNRRKLKQMHDLSQWEQLSNAVVNIGYDKDLSYYYLGRSMEELGYSEAAVKYYNLGLLSNKCGGEILNVCDGFVFPRDINNRILNLNKPIDKVEKEKIKTSSVLSTQINLPSGWVEKPLTEELRKMKIEYMASNQFIDAWLRYWTFSKSAIVKSEIYVNNARAYMTNSLKNGRSSEIVQTFVNSKKAYRFEVSGATEKGVDITYLVTFVEDGDSLVRLDIWMTQAKFPDFKDYLATLANGLKINVLPREDKNQQDTLTAGVAERPTQIIQDDSTKKFTTSARRLALVIGNDSYKSVAKLENAREDARTIASNLNSVGYQVTLKLDLNEKEMKSALRNFASQVQGGDEVMFFFAGHGVQLGSANYLLPTDIVGDSEAQIRDEAIQLQRVLDDMSEKKAKFTLAMIDACRDNPFKSAGRAIGGRGLAPTTAATGQMVIFSAGTGQQALDRLNASDKSKNGLFTRVFVQEMQKPNLSIDRVVKNVRNQVADLAKSVGHEQVPAIYDQVLGDFYFKK
jgi:hypothetical protein